MIRGSHYRKLAAQARRLADAMHQPDVIEVLQIAAREYEALAVDSELADQERPARKQG
ncbi:MAG TPA: hypothetical protein VM689_26525 [Aliidongia sp.]|nr:hypothetical protein [Aliidongia sp.]